MTGTHTLGLYFAHEEFDRGFGRTNTERHRICAIDGDDMARRSSWSVEFDRAF